MQSTWCSFVPAPVWPQKAAALVDAMWAEGYCGLDIVGTLFRVTKFEDMSDRLKLDFIKVCVHHHIFLLVRCLSLLH